MTEQALYRFFDQVGNLLYVGISMNPGRRWRQHGRVKPWWHEVAQISVETLPSRSEALAAELDAIRTESPRYNIQGKGPIPQSPAPFESTIESWVDGDTDPTDIPAVVQQADSGLLGWLKKRPRADDGVDDLVMDLRRDPDLRWQRLSGSQLWKHLRSHGACSAAIDCLTRAAAEYQASS